MSDTVPAIKTPTLVPDEQDFLPAVHDVVRAKILHSLSIYPKLSPSMLQVGIGTALSPRIWHPVLACLEKEGTVIREELSKQSPIGRDQVYTILRLATDIEAGE